jgi:hypothetical protein
MLGSQPADGIPAELDRRVKPVNPMAVAARVAVVGVGIFAAMLSFAASADESATSGQNAATPAIVSTQADPKHASVNSQPASNASSLVLQAEVVDSDGRPLAGAHVVVAISYSRASGDPDVVTERKFSSDTGRIRVEVTRNRENAKVRVATIWAYKPGLAIAFSYVMLAEIETPPVIRMALAEPLKYTITVRGPDDEPVAGLRLAPSVVRISINRRVTRSTLPDGVLESLTVTTDARGVAAPNYLPQTIVPLAVRVAGANVAPQSLPLESPDGRNVVLKMGRPGRLVGIVRTQEGLPLAGVPVDVWMQGSGTSKSGVGDQRVTPDAVLRLGETPLKTGPQGAFQTPPKLLGGSAYRVAIRQAGFQPFISDWVRLDGERASIPDIRLRRTYMLSGVVKDRQGREIPGARVFLPGGGPIIVTDASGRFALPEVRSGRTVILAECPGFQIHGRVVDPSAQIMVGSLTLARGDEAAREVMKPIPNAVPDDELRRLAYRLLEPYLHDGADGDDENARLEAISSLSTFDVDRALGVFQNGNFREKHAFYYSVQGVLAAELADKDPARAETLVEAIPELRTKVAAEVSLARALPAEERVRKQALLDRATKVLIDRLLNEKGAASLRLCSNVASAWLAIGERDRARAVVQAGRTVFDPLARRGGPYQSGFPGQLARVEPRQAFDWMNTLPADRARGMEVAEIAAELAYEHSAEAEQALRLREPGSDVTPAHLDMLRVCRRLARIDPPRASRVAKSIRTPGERACAWAFVALGLTEGRQAGAGEALDRAIREIDQIRQSGPGPVEVFNSSGVQIMYPTNPAAVILPVVERFAPDRVEEVFWRAVALHPHIDGDREDQLRTSYVGFECTLLARYDRAVAAALFEPTRAYLSAVGGGKEPGAGFTAGQIVAMGCLDPSAAVTYLESLNVPPKASVGNPAFAARLVLAEAWGLPPQQRWKQLCQSTGNGLAFEE